MKNKLLQQVLLMARSTFLGIFIQSLLCGLLVANDISGQKPESVEDIYISLDTRDFTIEELFAKITEKTDLQFAYESRGIKLSKKLSIKVKNESVGNILRVLSKEANIKFKRINDNIFVSKLPNNAEAITETLEYQVIEVTGRVTSSDDNEGLPGVNVIVKGTAIGTVTDVQGAYKLEMPDESTVLVFSSVGFIQEEVIVGSQTVIDLVLAPDITALEELVVIGYGSQSKHLVSTAIATISDDKLANIPVSNVAQALVGQVAGVSLQQFNGEPGVAPSIRIRGNGSLTSSSSPLYVIDGFPTTDAGLFSSIPPSEIKSIDILKDAASSAIYGSRAGNGVVVVTTKKGTSGKIRVTYNGVIGIEKVSTKVGVLSPEEYVEMATESVTNQGRDIPEWLTNENLWTFTDWQDVIFRDALVQDHALAVSGGNDNLKFNVSGGYREQQGILINSYMKRFNMRTGIDARLNKYIKLGVNAILSNTEDRVQSPSGTNTQSGVGGVIAVALTNPPIIPVWKDNGDYFIIFQDEKALEVFNVGLTNPLNKLDANKDFRKTFRSLTNTYLEIEPIQGLTIKSDLNINVTNGRREMYREGFLAKGGTNLGNISSPDFQQITAQRANSTTTELYWSNIAKYDFSFDDVHNFTALIGYDVSIREAFSTSVSPRTDADNPIAFVNDDVKNVEGAVLTTGSSSFSRYTFDGLFTRINYNYKSKYILSASIRRDRSSRFGPNNRTGIFPSISGAWNILEGDKTNTQLKLRGSYGETGNDRIGGDYPWISGISQNSYVFGGPGSDASVLTYAPNGFTNEDLSWEKNKQTNIGIDVGLFNERVGLTVDIYERNSNTILSTSVPSLNGISNRAIVNIGKVKNSGLEILASYRNLNGAVKWNSSFNISFNKNEIVELAPGQELLPGGRAGSIFGNVVRNYVGRPMGDMYLLIVEGTFNNQDDLDNFAQRGVQGIGDLRFRDANDDGRIDSDDQVLAGNYQPDFRYGWTNTITYKGFDFNLLIDGSYGGENFYILERGLTLGRARENNVVAALGRWKSEANPGNGTFGIAGTSNLGSVVGPSTRYLHDASFLRIRNISLGYNIPSELTSKWKMDNIRVYFVMQNLYTFTKFPGFNPEGNHLGDNAINNGVDEGTYPLAKNFSIGLNVSF